MGSIYPYDESRIHGGVEAVALYLTRALAKRDDIELHVVSCNRTIKRSFTEKRGSITFHWLATGSKLYLLKAATIDAWRVRRIYNKVCPDIIHTQGIGEYSVAANTKAAMLLAVHGVEPFVTHMQNTSHFQGLTGRYRNLFTTQLAKQSIRHSSGIISNSGEYVPRLLDTWFAGKPIYRIPNPIAQDFFSLEQNEDSVDTHPLILWAGQITERKDVIGLLHSFAVVVSSFPNAHLVLIGNVTDPKYFNRVQDTIITKGLSRQVSIVGHIKQSKLLNMYGKASIMAMSSIEETAPMAIAQAMAAGKPIVATRVGGVPWMVEDEVTGFLVDVGDIKDMAKRLMTLLRDKPKRQRMGQTARKVAQHRFAADAVAEQTVQAYRDILRKAGKNY